MRQIHAMLIWLALWSLLSPGDAAARPAALPRPGMADLRQELAALVAAWPGDTAVSVVDLQTGEAVAVNGARPQLAACTIKIPLMMAVAQDIDAGRYSADSVSALVQAAMGPSATAPARSLFARVGGGQVGAGVRRVNELMGGLGMASSLVTHPPGYYWEEYGYAESHGISDNLLTASDLTAMLAMLYYGEALSPTATDYVLWSMTIAPPWMDASLGDALPADARLYHKIGQLYQPNNTWNDAGIVTFRRDGRERAYALAFLSTGAPSWQDAYGYAQRVSSVVWRHMSAAPAPADTPARGEQELGRYATASADSVRAPETIAGLGTVSYGPANTLDRDPTSSWVEGEDGPGVGTGVRLDFAQPVRLSAIGVDVGYDRDTAIFMANNRLRRARLIFDDGSVQELRFRDRRGIQRAALAPVTTSSVRIEIADVWAGAAYDDTAIAALKVWGTLAP